MGSLLCAKSAPTTSAPFSAPRLCASTRKVSHNEKLESDAFQAARDYHPTAEGSWVTAVDGDGRKLHELPFSCLAKATLASHLPTRTTPLRRPG